MPLAKFNASIFALILMVSVDILLTLGGRDRGLNIISRLERIEHNQVVFLKGVMNVPTP